MYLDVFKDEEMFDLRFEILSGNQKKLDPGCQELYTIMQVVPDVLKG